jgi:hypothetical protein
LSIFRPHHRSCLDGNESSHRLYQADTRASSALAVDAVGDISLTLATMIAAGASTGRPPHEVGAIAGDGGGVIVATRLVALFVTRARSIRGARSFRDSKDRGKYSWKVLGH